MTQIDLVKTFSLIYFSGDINDENKQEIIDKGFALIYLFNSNLCNNLLQFSYKESHFQKLDGEHILNISLEFNNEEAYQNFTENDINHLVSLVLDNPISSPSISNDNNYFQFLELKLKDYIFSKDVEQFSPLVTSIQKRKF